MISQQDGQHVAEVPRLLLLATARRIAGRDLRGLIASGQIKAERSRFGEIVETASLERAIGRALTRAEYLRADGRGGNNQWP
jgi:hypothetical protein